MERTEIGIKIREARKQKGFTQLMLAELLDTLTPKQRRGAIDILDAYVKGFITLNNCVTRFKIQSGRIAVLEKKKYSMAILFELKCSAILKLNEYGRTLQYARVFFVQ